MHVILLTHVVYADIEPIHILGWTVPLICQRTAEQQPLHMSGFLRVIYAILNASVILERNETRLARNETRLARNETRLARNETRGGNLPLSGTVNKVRYKCFLRVSEFLGEVDWTRKITNIPCVQQDKLLCSFYVSVIWRDKTECEYKFITARFIQINIKTRLCLTV